MIWMFLTMAAQIKPEKMGLFEKRSIYKHRLKQEPHYQPIPVQRREFQFQLDRAELPPLGHQMATTWSRV